MENKEIYHNYEIIEYLEMLSVYDQDVILSYGNIEYTAILSCNEFVEVEPINN